MKQCLKCGRQYDDIGLNFCLQDGEMLVDGPLPQEFSVSPNDPPPTIFMDQARITNPLNTWQQTPSAPPAVWQNDSAFSPPVFQNKIDQTLPTIALILGIASVVLICCYGGIWLGIPAAIVGFIGLKNVDADPQKFGGKGMAVAGLVLGIITCIISLSFFFLSFLVNL